MRCPKNKRKKIDVERGTDYDGPDRLDDAGVAVCVAARMEIVKFCNHVLAERLDIRPTCSEIERDGVSGNRKDDINIELWFGYEGASFCHAPVIHFGTVKQLLKEYCYENTEDDESEAEARIAALNEISSYAKKLSDLLERKRRRGNGSK